MVFLQVERGRRAAARRSPRTMRSSSLTRTVAASPTRMRRKTAESPQSPARRSAAADRTPLPSTPAPPRKESRRRRPRSPERKRKSLARRSTAETKVSVKIQRSQRTKAADRPPPDATTRTDATETSAANATAAATGPTSLPAGAITSRRGRDHPRSQSASQGASLGRRTPTAPPRGHPPR